MIQAISTQIKKKEDSINEIFLAIFSIAKCYFGLYLKVKIVRIYKNQFKSKKLYKFCYLKSHKNKNRDENIIFKNN